VTVLPIERALLRVVPFLIVGLMVSLPLLVVTPGDTPRGWFIVELAVVVVIGHLMTISMLGIGDEPWFAGARWSATVRSIASGVVLVVFITGTIGLITLAASAALRLHPSLQFLQLLSALDIAWAGAALTFGVYRAFSRGWAIAAGALLGAICVWSIWNYLANVGFGPSGSWIVSAGDLFRYVLPFDVMAAVAGVGMFLYGVRSQVHATEQPRPQS